MRILYLPAEFPSKKHPKEGMVLDQLVSDISKCGVDVDVVALHRHFTELGTSKMIREQINDHLEVLHFHGWSFPILNALMLKNWTHQSAKKLIRALTLRKYDLIHVHGYIHSVLAHELSKRLNIPFIVSLHHNKIQYNEIKEWKRPILLSSWKSAKNIVVPTNNFRSAIVANYGLDAIDVIPYYSDFRQIKKKTQLNRQIKQSLSIVMNYEELKHVVDFAINQQIMLTIGGNCKNASKVMKKVERLNKGHLIHWIGAVSASLRKNMYKDYDCFIAPHRNGIKQVHSFEAMAAGVPIYMLGTQEIASSTGAMEFETSWRTFSRNYKNFDTSVICSVAKNFSKGRVLPKYIALYEACMKEK